jgi:hypothetical protein
MKFLMAQSGLQFSCHLSLLLYPFGSLENELFNLPVFCCTISNINPLSFTPQAQKSRFI